MKSEKKVDGKDKLSDNESGKELSEKDEIEKNDEDKASDEKIESLGEEAEPVDSVEKEEAEPEEAEPVETEEIEHLREELGLINMEQGVEVGFISITGSPSDADEVAYASDEKYSKQLGSESYFTYTFEKPILFSGYMIKTGAGAEGFGQPRDWTVRVNDIAKG